MAELQREDVLEETEYKSMDSDGEELTALEAFSQIEPANGVDRARFERIPDESQIQESETEDVSHSADPLNIYYRSMHGMPLLAKHQEIELAKKYESAKMNVLAVANRLPHLRR
jgi:DNA-directed RNA polymerase sigma subunit (sigma70/sigma32)